jgi:uroporphyrinogen-III synthase
MRPLEGRRILVTREKSASLRVRLEAQGATVVEVPTIQIAPPSDPAPLQAALARVGTFSWIAFTSGNAVEAVGDALQGPLPRIGIASVGPSTSTRILQVFGRGADLEPRSAFKAEGLLAAFAEHGLAGGESVLLPVSDRARLVLREGLERLGARVESVVAYRTLIPEGLREALAAALATPFDLVVLASPSAVEGFCRAPDPGSAPVAVLGPVTAEAASSAGLDVRLVAQPPTLEGLVQGIVQVLGPHTGGGAEGRAHS